MSTKACTYLIIGSGPTGLGAAHRLRELGIDDFLIVERASGPGGLARSMQDERGFTWDIGGHVHFSHYPYYDRALAQFVPEESWNILARESFVWIKNRFVPFPLQNNLHHLPMKDRLLSTGGMIRARASGSPAPENYLQWMQKNAGSHLTELFMEPYNLKVWAWPADEMSTGWLGERVAAPSLSSVIKNTVFPADDRTWGPNSTFRFPKSGGTGGIWQAMAKGIGADTFIFNAEIVAVDVEQKQAILSTGETIGYKSLLSTIPLDQLALLAAPRVPASVAQAASELRHSSTHIVGLGLRGDTPPHLKEKNWMYFPESDAPFYRATVFSNYSDTHVPEGGAFWSLMTETASSPHKPVKEELLAEETVQGALNTGLISSREDIVSVWTHREEYGYPTPTIERDEVLRSILPYFESKNIWSRGRFGGWKYEVSNQDHSFMQGVEWADRMHSKKEEETYII